MLDLETFRTVPCTPLKLTPFLKFDSTINLKKLKAINKHLQKKLQLTSEMYCCFKFYYENKLVGYIITEIRDKHKDLVLCNLYLVPKIRRQGTGRFLIEQLKTTVKNIKKEALVTFVSERNLEAQLFLRACGLCYDYTHKNWFGEGHDAYKFIWVNSSDRS